MAWLSTDFDSKALQMPVSVNILVPQGAGNYKTIYLLHGAGGDKSTWLLKTRIADYAEEKNVAVIMPSGNNSFYVNQKHGKNYMDFICNELPQLCESWLPLLNDRKNRMIAGMSMGGYGAFVNALHHPEIFGYAASFSGTLDIMKRYDDPRELDMYRVFGDRNELKNSNHELFELINQSADNLTDGYPKFMIMCGEQDERLEMSEKAYAQMSKNGYSTTFEKSLGGHDFTYWDMCIKKAFDWFLQEREEV